MEIQFLIYVFAFFWKVAIVLVDSKRMKSSIKMVGAPTEKALAQVELSSRNNKLL